MAPGQLGRTQCAWPNSTDVGLAAQQAAALLHRAHCLSGTLLLGTGGWNRVDPLIDAADAEVMVVVVVEAVHFAAVEIQWVGFVVNAFVVNQQLSRNFGSSCRRGIIK